MRHLFTILLAFISCTMFSQEIELKKGETVEQIQKGAYYRFSELNKFSGTWLYNQGATDIKIVIVNKKTFLPGKGLDFYRDYLQGYYCFEENDCKMNEEGYDFKNGTTTTDQKLAEFIFWDHQKNKQGTATLELLPGEANRAKLKLYNSENIRINKGTRDSTFSLPSNIILKKSD